MKAEDFKNWRNRAGLSQRNAAFLLDVGKTTILRWEKGKYIPPYLTYACRAIDLMLPPWQEGAQEVREWREKWACQNTKQPASSVRTQRRFPIGKGKTKKLVFLTLLLWPTLHSITKRSALVIREGQSRDFFLTSLPRRQQHVAAFHPPFQLVANLRPCVIVGH